MPALEHHEQHSDRAAGVPVHGAASGSTGRPQHLWRTVSRQ